MPDVEIEATVNIDVWCSCGEGLCMQSDGGSGCVTVEPCRKCLEAAKDDGYDSGLQDGHTEGYNECLKEYNL